MKILLCAVNSRFNHKAPALWSIKAYCDAQKPDYKIEIYETSVNAQQDVVLAEIYSQKPDIVGFSCYIWNISAVRRFTRSLRKILPDAVIIYGGPEVSYDGEAEPADYIAAGEGEMLCHELFTSLSRGEKPANKVITGVPPDFAALPSFLTEQYFASFENTGIENMLVYYESARGCPFRCSYCLSADSRVRTLPTGRVFEDMRLLCAKGARIVKFTDRTFNADRERAKQIIRFAASLETECTFHFEAAPDLFDKPLLDEISKLPRGRVQFELGVQSTNEQTLGAVCRNTDTNLALENISILRGYDNCRIHADLIAGLPHDTPESFAQAINDCITARPHILQLGFLKMLRGSDMREKADEFKILYDGEPPYETLSSGSMSYDAVVHFKSIERVIDRYYNSGLFQNSITLAISHFDSAHECFCAMAERGMDSASPVSQARAYGLLYSFLSDITDEKRAAYAVSLDCMTYDPKTPPPEGVSIDYLPSLSARRAAEAGLPRRSVRAAYFEADDTTRIFYYTGRDPVTKAYKTDNLAGRLP